MTNQSPRGSLRHPRNATATVVAGAGARLVGRGVSAVSALLATSLAVRLLGLENYGVLAFALSSMALATGVVSVGVGHGTTRTIAALSGSDDAKAASGVARGAISLALGGGCIGGIFIALFTSLQTSELGLRAELVVGASIGVLLVGTSVTRVVSSLARGMVRVVTMELPQAILSLLRLVGVGTLFVLGVADVRLLAVALGIAGVIAAVASLRLGHRVLPLDARSLVPSASGAIAVARTFAPFALITVAIVATSRVAVLVLGLSGNSAAVGEFDASLKVIEQGIGLVSSLLGAVYLPIATILFGRQRHLEFRTLYQRVSNLNFLLTVPAIIALVAFSPAVLGLFYGSGFPVDPTIVRILVTAFAISVAVGFNSSALMSSASGRELAKIGGIVGLGSLILSLIFVPALGVLGAAVATMLSILFMNGTVGWSLFHRTGAHPFHARLLITFFSASVPASVGVLVAQSIGPTNIFVAAGWSVGLWLVWVAGLMLVGVIKPSEFGVPVSSELGSGPGTSPRDVDPNLGP